MHPFHFKVLRLASKGSRIYIGFRPLRAPQVGWSKKVDGRSDPHPWWVLQLWWWGYLKRDSRWTHRKEYGYPGTHLTISSAGLMELKKQAL